MTSSFRFGKDVFLKTDHPTAVDSQDRWSPVLGVDHSSHFVAAPNGYYGQPVSFICDSHSGATMAQSLRALYPSKLKLLDLGTAAGSVPLTMREVGMLALGLEGLDEAKRGGVKPYMLPNDEARARFAWHHAPDIVDCCDITKPFRIEDASGQLVKFDYIISTDCFEHLVTERVPQLIDNIYDHLDDDGYGIFEINTGEFFHIHQTVKPVAWWIEVFSQRFVIENELSARDFTYVRSRMFSGKLTYIADDRFDGWKMLFWARKKR